jgi:hypothetical protein
LFQVSFTLVLFTTQLEAGVYNASCVCNLFTVVIHGAASAINSVLACRLFVKFVTFSQNRQQEPLPPANWHIINLKECQWEVLERTVSGYPHTLENICPSNGSNNYNNDAVNVFVFGLRGWSSV